MPGRSNRPWPGWKSCAGRRSRWWQSRGTTTDRKSTRLNSSHLVISYAVFCLKKKNFNNEALPVLLHAEETPWETTPAVQLPECIPTTQDPSHYRCRVH